MLYFQFIFCSNELKWIKIFNSFQSIFVCWETLNTEFIKSVSTPIFRKGFIEIFEGSKRVAFRDDRTYFATFN